MSNSEQQPCIVVGKLGPKILERWGDLPRAGVLMNGDGATVFHSRQQARRAIQRSARYAEEMGYDWDVLARPWELRIVNLYGVDHAEH
jgi:hypothetical protein